MNSGHTLALDGYQILGLNSRVTTDLDHLGCRAVRQWLAGQSTEKCWCTLSGGKEEDLSGAVIWQP